jgi:ribonuclease HI
MEKNPKNSRYFIVIIMTMYQQTLFEAWGIAARPLNMNQSDPPAEEREETPIPAGPTETMSILQWNAHTLTSKKAEIATELAHDLNANILCISELGHRRDIKGFRCVTSSDLHTQTGIFLASYIDAKTELISDPNLCLHEARIIGQGVKFYTNAREFIILHVYIPPETNHEHRSEYWRQIQPFIWSNVDVPLLICGDINTKSPLLCPNHNESHPYFETFINDSELEILNTGEPTRGENALDACLANATAAQITNLWRPLPEYSSDHRPCLIETIFPLPSEKETKKNTKPFSYVNIKLSVERLLQWLRSKYLRNPQEQLDIIQIWEAIQQNLVISTCWQPVARFWNNELSILKRRRNNAYRRQRESPEALDRFKALDQQFKRLFNKTKLEFQRTEVEQMCQNDPTGSKAWAICKILEPEMRTRRKKTWRTNTILPEEQANRIAKKFSEISSDPTLDPNQEEMDVYNQQLAEARLTMQNASPITTEEITRAIQQARSKGAAGPDTISPKLLKEAFKYPMFMNALRGGFNIASRAGKFPDCWKMAKVIPLPKAQLDEFRPISLLNSLSKIFEKILEQRIRESIGDKLNPIQHGCRSGHNTTQALGRFAHANGTAAAQMLEFGAIAFDFSKAYDRVPKTKLISKLVKLGVPGPLIVMVDSWLTNRNLSVHHRGAKSRPYPLPHGIPQGSSLSVLLWLIYINDLGDRLDPNTSNLYVDDSLIWAASTRKSTTLTALTAQAHLLADWADENKVKINWDKTQLIFSTHRPSDPSLIIRGHTIRPSKKLKYLGVDFESNNSYHALMFNLKDVGADIRRRAGVVRRLNRYNFPLKTIRKFTEGFVYAKLRYISPLLGAESTKLLEPIEKGLRAAIRTEIGAFRSTPIALLFRGGNRLRLKQLIQRDSTRLILRSIAHQTLLGQEFLAWDGYGAGWSPYGMTKAFLKDIQQPLPIITPIHPISIRVRDALQKCQYHFNYTKDTAVAMHTRGALIQSATLSLWCDGSFLNDQLRAGAAALLYDANNTIIGTRQDVKMNVSSSYEGELLALLTGLHMLRDRGPTNQTIRIYTDSKSIITHLHAIGTRYRPEDDTIKECSHLIARLIETNTVALHWIPGHRNIGFNEDADRLAKEALQTPTVAHPSDPIRLSTYNLLLSKRTQDKSLSLLNSEIQESSFRDYPPREPFTRMKPKDVVLGPIFRMRTGHTYCLAHLKNLDMVSDDNCRLCSTPTRETVEHQLLDCPHLADELQELREWMCFQNSTPLDRLRKVMWKRPRQLERFVVKAIKAGAHI